MVVVVSAVTIAHFFYNLRTSFTRKGSHRYSNDSDGEET